jgi:hypothetical protein
MIYHSLLVETQWLLLARKCFSWEASGQILNWDVSAKDDPKYNYCNVFAKTKKDAIEFAKKFYEDILLRERNLLPLGSSPVFERVARELLIEQSQLIERGERTWCI